MLAPGMPYLYQQSEELLGSAGVLCPDTLLPEVTQEDTRPTYTLRVTNPGYEPVHLQQG